MQYGFTSVMDRMGHDLLVPASRAFRRVDKYVFHA